LAIVATRSTTLEGQGLGQQMSALGQKRTCAMQLAMPVLRTKGGHSRTARCGICARRTSRAHCEDCEQTGPRTTRRNHPFCDAGHSGSR